MKLLTTHSEINRAIDISVGQLSTPTSSSWNNLVEGILLDGIYSGGKVVADVGLKVAIEPFIIRVGAKTVRLTGDSWASVTLPTSGEFLIVASIETDSRLKDVIILSAIPSATFNSSTMLAFAKVIVPAQANQIENSMIDMSSVAIMRSLDPDKLFGKIRNGSGKFKTDAIINHSIGHLKYSVFIQPENGDATVGDITYEKFPDKVIVQNSGGSTAEFSWLLVINAGQSVAEGIHFGQTLASKNVQRLEHNLNNANYFPALTPLEPSKSSKSSWWVVKDKNDFNVQLAGDPQKLAWAAIPINANMFTGIASFSDADILHGLGTKEYKFFWTSLSANCPSEKLSFEYEPNRVVIQNGGEGLFQYLIIKDSQALTGTLKAGLALKHLMNREDYLVLASSKTNSPFSINMTKNEVYLTSGTDIDVAILPKTCSWVLGDWTRPSLSPQTHRIEFSGFVTAEAEKGKTVFYQISTQKNIIRKAIAQVLPANPLGESITLQLYVNDKLTSTINISGDSTSAAVNLPPLAVNVGDIIKVVLVSNPPKSTVAFSWYGNGEVSADIDLELLKPENAPAFSIIKKQVVTWPGLTGEITLPSKYLVGTNCLTLTLNGSELYLDKDYIEVSENTIKLLDITLKDSDYLVAEIFIGEHPQSEKYLNGRPLTAEEAANLSWTKEQVDSLRTWVSLGCPGIKLSKDMVESLKSLKIDIEGTLTGEASKLKGLSISGDKLQALIEILSSKKDTDSHFHDSDRDRANHEGTQPLDSIEGIGEAASKNVTSSMSNKSDVGKVLLVGDDNRIQGLVHTEDVGSAAGKDVGSDAGNIPVIDNSGKLPISIIPLREIDDYSVGNSAGEIPVLNKDGKLEKGILPVTSLAYLDVGTKEGQVPVYSKNGSLYNTVTPKDLGSASKCNVGTSSGEIPTLNNLGKLPISLLAVGSAAGKNVGTDSGEIPILDENGKLPISTLSLKEIFKANPMVIGTSEGEIPVYTKDSRLYNTVAPKDLGSAAGKNVGTGPGQLPSLNSDGKLPRELIEGLGTAAFLNASGITGTIPVLDEQGKLDYSILKNTPQNISISVGTNPGDIAKYDDNGKLFNTLSKSDVGSASKKDIGIKEGQIPILIEGGKLSKEVLPFPDKSGAYHSVGVSANNLVVLGSDGKIPKDILPKLDMTASVGTSPGDLVAVNGEGKLESSLLPDFKDGAFLPAGKQPGGLVVYDETGNLPLPEDVFRVTSKESAAFKNVGDEEGEIPVLTVGGLVDLSNLISQDKSEMDIISIYGDNVIDEESGLSALAALRFEQALIELNRRSLVSPEEGKSIKLVPKLVIDLRKVTSDTLEINLDDSEFTVLKAAKRLSGVECSIKIIPPASNSLTLTFSILNGKINGKDKVNILTDDLNFCELAPIYIDDMFGWMLPESIEKPSIDTNK